MSVVTSLTATPGRIQVLLGTCASLGGRVARSELDLLISPKSLRPIARQVEDSDESAVVEEVISECRALGFVRVDGAFVALTPDGASAASDLLAAVGPILTDAESARTHGQEEFPFLLCWLLMQDPYVPIPWSDAPVIDVQRVIGADESLARAIPKSVAGFQQFHYWARFLGFAQWLRAGPSLGVLPIPTIAVWRAIATAGIERGSVVPAHAFVAAVGRACPVLDGGSLREKVEAGREVRAYVPGQSVSEGLGLALKTLVAMTKLHLDTTADADRMVLVPGERGQLETFSHVRIL